MSERNTSKPWTEEEDRLLRHAVTLFGENDNWKKVACSIPGRTNKACRKRWLHSLQPNVKKTAWTPSEDKMLVDLFETYGPKWSAIARQIRGRTDDACSKRYREALDPSLKKDQWTHEEDVLLMDTYNRIGGKWQKVGQELQRSGLGCRNRWRLLERKKASRANQTMSPAHAITIREIPVTVEEPPPIVQSQEAPLHVHWPPYYPPEAYTTFPTEENTGERSFREPSPEVLQLPDPKVAPFQFSSSSLLTALSDPPRPHAPLPPISAVNTPELVQYDIPNESERQPSLSPLSQCNGIPEMNDILMSLDDYTQSSIEQLPLDVSVSQLAYDGESFNNLRQFTDSDIYTASPFSIPSEIIRTEPYLWKPRGIPEFYDSPRSTFGGSVLYEDYSSASSTPFVFSSPLSPTSSPLPATLLDLPSTEHPSSNSLLFSPANDARATAISTNIRRARKNTTRKPKPTIKVPVATRLSSTLPLSSDPNVRPYACGRPQCWPNNEITSSSCFATSGELLDHSKEQHPDEDAAEKPYRCALTGCGKSWKSINGLQYHLQISTAHFATALSSRFSAQLPGTPDLNTPSSLDGEIDDLEPERKYMCPQPGCFKAYRQPSGLRYHIKYGHPPDIPTQLSVVPPALERQIPIKAKKLRAKPPPEPVPN